MTILHLKSTKIKNIAVELFVANYKLVGKLPHVTFKVVMKDTVGTKYEFKCK